MQLKALVSVIAMTLGLGGVAYAGDYTPPENIQCRLNATGKLSCDGFNRQYLVEHTYTADFDKRQEKNLGFSSAAAYVDQGKWAVLVTYKDIKNKSVLLRTINYSIKPDLNKQSWINHKNEYYTCNISYSACSLIS